MEQPTLYNKIGKDYNDTRKADPYIAGRLYALLEAEKGKAYLDIGCGTGNYTIKLAGMGLHMTGMDPSELMLQEARSRNSEIDWICAPAEMIPLHSNTIDGAIATFTTHHWTNPEQAFAELYRILKPGAPIVMLTFMPEQEHGYWLRHYFPEMIARTVNRKTTYEVVTKAAVHAGFCIDRTEKYFIHEGLEDLFLYSGKNRPEMYFDPAVQNGISSFSMTENKEEIVRGLAMLRNDMDSGRFEDIRKEFENDLGDYLFVVLKKE